MLYKLRRPEYASDRAAAMANPVRLLQCAAVPSIRCERCGVWASSDRLATRVEQDSVGPFMELVILDRAEWFRRLPEWERTLRIKPGMLTPGAEISYPRVELRGRSRDFMFASGGRVLVRENIKRAIESNRLTGVRLCPVVQHGNPAAAGDELWQLEVHGGAHTVSRDKCRVGCDLCGRPAPPSRGAVDIATWTGHDFVVVDGNPNIIYVSNRAAEVLLNLGASNVVIDGLSGASG